MYDRRELKERLEDTLEALERIPRRLESIHTPDDFLADDTGREHLDSVCMILLAAGEAFRQLDAKTKGDWRTRYPQFPWRDTIGLRNVIAHGYFDIDAEQVFNICKENLPELIQTVRTMIKDLENGTVS